MSEQLENGILLRVRDALEEAGVYGWGNWSANQAEARDKSLTELNALIDAIPKEPEKHKEFPDIKSEDIVKYISDFGGWADECSTLITNAVTEPK